VWEGVAEEVAEGAVEGVVEGAAEEGRNPTLRGKFSLLHHCDVIHWDMMLSQCHWATGS